MSTSQKSESRISKEVLVTLGSKPDCRLFRNNIGTAIQGQRVKGKIESSGDGVVVIKGARYVKYGICNPGGSDLLGFKVVEITQDMVGSKMAQFLVIETKDYKGVATKEQLSFIAMVISKGGLAGVARTKEEALSIFEGK